MKVLIIGLTCDIFEHLSKCTSFLVFSTTCLVIGSCKSCKDCTIVANKLSTPEVRINRLISSQGNVLPFLTAIWVQHTILERMAVMYHLKDLWLDQWSHGLISRSRQANVGPLEIDL